MLRKFRVLTVKKWLKTGVSLFWNTRLKKAMQCQFDCTTGMYCKALLAWKIHLWDAIQLEKMQQLRTGGVTQNLW